MILAVHSNVSYPNEPRAKAHSHTGGHFFLSNSVEIPPKPNNGAALNIAIDHIIKHDVMTSATKAEPAALYIIAGEAVFIRIILEELGHKQPLTPLQTDQWAMESSMVGRKPWICFFIG